MRVVSVKMDEDMIEAVRAEARARGVSFSELVRAAIRFYLARADRKCQPFVTRRIRVWDC